MVLKSRKCVEINQIKHLINKSKGDKKKMRLLKIMKERILTSILLRP